MSQRNIQSNFGVDPNDDKQHVLVTGGAGYIGSTLSKLLIEHGYKVTVLDRFFFGPVFEKTGPSLRLVKGDIRTIDKEILETVDAVIDMAALSNDPAGDINPELTMDINYRGRKRICELSIKQGVKHYILASTCSIYGQRTWGDESTPPQPLTTYAKAHRLAEQFALKQADQHFSVTVLRQATCFGASNRMRFDLVVNKMVRDAYCNNQITVVGGGQWRPLVHVKDTSRAFIAALENTDTVNGEIYNVGAEEQNYTINQLAETIRVSLPKPINIKKQEADDEQRSYQVCFDKIKRDLNYDTNTTVVDSSQTINEKISAGELNPDDPRSITVDWYRMLMDNSSNPPALDVRLH